MRQGFDRTIKIVKGVTLWTSSRAADYWGISKTSLISYAKRDSRLIALKIGKYMFFKREELDRHINDSTTIGVATRK
jgi:hypothetical protein